jgi:penicillin-binding protein 1A
LAKNLFPRKPDRNMLETVIIKLKEWVTATKLERDYTKDEILAMYFNTVPFGSQAYGIKSAARTYFDKDPSEMNIDESALLIGILKAPSWYNPVSHPDRALLRRHTVLRQMARYGFITPLQFDTLDTTSLDMSQYSIMDHTTGIARHFREYLRNYLNDWCDNHFKPDGTPYNLYKDGLRIYTTINSKMQEYAEEAVNEHLGKDLQPAFFQHWKGYPNAPFVFEPGEAKKEINNLMLQAVKRSDRYRMLKEDGMPDDSIMLSFRTPVKMTVFSWKGNIDTLMTPWDSIRYYKYFLRAGLMSVEPNTGYVRAYVCSPEYRYFKYDNVIYGKRQVGSTFKPVLYTLAMQEGDFSPCSEIPNIQYSIELDNGDIWEPENTSEYKMGQMITLKEALAHSNNWISTYLIKRYTPQAVVMMAHKMGITSDIPPVYSIALGSADLSLYEMVGAFNTFASKGIFKQPVFITRIEDKNGNVIQSFIPEQHEAMSEETAYLMLELMKGVVETGTGIRLRLKYGFTNPIAGKTGTTQNYSDGWFIGLTPDLVTGIWVGCEDRAAHFRTMTLGQGANMALPIWAIYMKKIYADATVDVSQGDFEKPLRPISVDLDCSKHKAKAGRKNPFDDEGF